MYNTHNNVLNSIVYCNLILRFYQINFESFYLINFKIITRLTMYSIKKSTRNFSHKNHFLSTFTHERNIKYKFILA